jgi:tetratricopeptide (TPR) repeat protein
LPADVSIRHLQPVKREGKTWLGRSWAAQREGLKVVYLEGSPFEIGYAHGVLMQAEMHTLEDEFVQMIKTYVPEQWKIDTLKNYIIFRNRHLSSYVPDEYRLEMYATTLGCPDKRPEEGSFYNRLLNYHAAHDVSYLLIDNPLITRAGCTAFAAWGSVSTGGHLVTGRNFDWEAAEVFSRDRVVIMCQPQSGIPFISLAWAGMAGVVSGMNRSGVSVTINGAPSSLPKDTATPVAMVARNVLQRASNLAEAQDIIQRAKVFVSSLWLVGSRSDGRFVVIEKTPTLYQVREPTGETMLCANHFETAGLHGEERNRAYMLEATSVSRLARLNELLPALHGSVDAPRVASLLRDRNLSGDFFGGNGHRAALNALIATHSTIMDLTAGIFWAASPPNQLGKFVAFDVNDFSRELPHLTVPADPILESGEFERSRKAQAALQEGFVQLKASRWAHALESARTAENLNPGYYRNSTLRGRALLGHGEKAEAAKAFQVALAGQPAFHEERIALANWLQQARGRQ